MANQARCYVKNESNMGKIKVNHLLPNGTSASGTPVEIPNPDDGDEKHFNVNSTDEKLIIEDPINTQDSRYNSIRLRADTDISLRYLRTDHTWKIQIIPNTLPPEAPTDVNVTIGDEDP